MEGVQKEAGMTAEDILRLYAARIRCALRSRGAAFDTIEDVCQLVFLRCERWMQRHAQTRPYGRLPRQVTVLKWAEHAHYAVLRKQGSEDRFRPKYQSFAQTRFDEESKKLDPAGVIEEAERRALVRAEVDALRPERRAVIMLDMEGWSEREIAHKLGVTVAVVKNQLHRARRQLGEKLKRLWD
jgi:RNA polymerase sigma factor (sigma-70 family)